MIGEPEKEDSIQEPEFKDYYVAAFCALMLAKMGGMQQITVELLEKFPKKDTPVIEWNPKTKAFMMKTLAYHQRKKRKRQVIKPRRNLILPT